jgi:hypothetical protein
MGTAHEQTLAHLRLLANSPGFWEVRALRRPLCLRRGILICMATEYYVKTLRLVPPEIANGVGIQAEAPVFVSPEISSPGGCLACGVTFSPLVYQVGHVTTAQHWHPCSGGIFYYVLRQQPFPQWLTEPTGWVALLEPIGHVCLEEDERINRPGHAPAVRCLQIVPWCQGQVWELHRQWGYPPSSELQREWGYPLYWQERRRQWEYPPYREPPYRHEPHILDSGVIGKPLRSCGAADNLLPLCDTEQPPEYAPFRFQVIDGEVLFTQRDRPVMARPCARRRRPRRQHEPGAVAQS